MARMERQALSKALFGDQFQRLPAKLAHSDPLERAKALAHLEAYVEDCLAPLLALKSQIAVAAYEADRIGRESRTAKNENRRSAPDQAPRSTASPRENSHEKEVANLEHFIGAP